MSLALAIVLLVAVVVTAALNVLKFQQLMQVHESARYAFVNRDIVEVLEQSMNLGLPLDQIENGQDILARQLELDPNISGIAVFDPTGDVLYQASRLPPGWVESALVQDWTREGSRHERYTTRPVVNTFGQPVGGVIVRYSEEPRERRNAAILRAMSLAVLGAAMVGVAIVWVGSSRLLGPFRNRLLATAALLRQAREDNPAVTARADEFEALAHTVLHDLRHTEREIDALADDVPRSRAGVAS